MDALADGLKAGAALDRSLRSPAGIAPICGRIY